MNVTKPHKEGDPIQANDTRASSIDPADLELFDKDGNPVDTKSLLQRMLDHPLSQEMYGMNKDAIVAQSKTKLGEAVINLVEHKLLRPWLPESANKALDSKIIGAVFRLFLSQGIGFSLAVLSNYLPDGKPRKMAKIAAQSVVHGGWDSTVDANDVAKFIGDLFNGDGGQIVKLMGHIDPSLDEKK